MQIGKWTGMALAVGFAAGCATTMNGVGNDASGSTTAAKRECRVDANGQSVCGYHCMLAPDGEVACADTASGTCRMSADGHVTCTHAAPVVAAKAALPPPECQMRSGKKICGYHCIDAFGDYQCAHTPAGVCVQSFGKITCWDPSAATLATYGAQPAQCKAAFGKVACGYHCDSGLGEVRCAQTPAGSCEVQGGSLVCTDP